ncbi:MAG TPA: CARDB domain-containing protein, partial [Anaerolineales bacterium]|nr:CARDB domain-containing protein [Anaerolineales bacterium]
RDPVWVEINVSGEAPHEGGYNFWQNACSAQWKSGAGPLPCPGTEGDSKGFIIPVNNSHLEDGTMGPAPSLLIAPENKYNGYIQGIFPTFTVQPGDHFVSVVGCEYGYSCYVTFRLDYMTANGGIFNFWSWREKNDSKNYMTNIDLSPLAGRSVRFILTVLTTGSSTGDRVRWGAPSIVRAGTTVTATPASQTPTPTQTNIPGDWLSYTNTAWAFELKYPPQSERFFETANGVLIKLPIAPGTNLAEKYLQVSVNEDVNPCQSPLSSTSPPGSPTETVVINGISFFKQTGGDAGMNQVHEWVGYSALKGNACISLDFVLHSINPGVFATPPPVFDKAAESAVFAQVMSTFAWVPLTPTPTFTSEPSPITDTPLPPTVNPEIVPSPNISRLFMLDDATGWAIGNNLVLRTWDGGATWYNITMPNVYSVLNGYFPDVNQGWALAPNEVYHTVDGGTRWSRYEVPFSGGYIQFLDDLHGFVLSGEASGMNKHAVSLYQTSDGGVTWTLRFAIDPSVPDNSLPFSGHKNGMTFRDTSTGWIGGDYPAEGYVYLYKTTDGGATWAKQSLALPAGYETASISITAPKFFSANDAILPVRMSTNAGSDIFIYISHDGGNTWTRAADIASHGRNTDFISMSKGFAWSQDGILLATDSAAANWFRITPNVNFGDNVAFMDFVSATTGWIMQSPVNGVTPLYRTTNGGSTWALVSGSSPAPLLPDLMITRMSFELQNPSCFSPNDSMGIRVWVKNNGQAAAGSIVVQVNNAGQTANGLGIGETTALFFPGSMNTVTAIVDLNNAISESAEQNNSRTEMLPVPTPPLPCITPTFTPTVTPTLTTPVALIGPYAVIRVSSNDVLNIRASAGTSQPVLGSFPPDSISVMRTGPVAMGPDGTWVEVQNPSGGTGWVNSYYLTEYVTHDTFCTDTRIPGLIEQLKTSVNQSNGDSFASLVSPVHGVDIHLWAYQPSVNFSVNKARMAFTSTESYNWGSGPRGEADFGTFKDII